MLATQNPIEQEGTYPLPEAQMDRFMLRMRPGYPETIEEEMEILRRRISWKRDDPTEDVEPVVGLETSEGYRRPLKQCMSRNPF